jgi:nucleoside-diphosphate-sugar epimerase
MRSILVTGATGFTGSHTAPLLLERYGQVTCLVRPSSDRAPVALPGVTFVEGDLDDPASLEAALRGKDTLINIAYLIGRVRDGAKRVEGLVRACRAAGVERAVFVSSTSLFTTLQAPTREARRAAERAIFDSGLAFTILRPTMIYGTPADRNLIRLVRFLHASPVMPVPGNGRFKQQPIFVEDLARAIVDCIEVEGATGNAYNLSGAAPLTFNELIDETCRAMGVRRLRVHLPLAPARWAARWGRRLPRRLRVTEEQLERLNEDKVFAHEEAARDFGFRPRPFREGIAEEVRHWRVQRAVPTVPVDPTRAAPRGAAR